MKKPKKIVDSKQRLLPKDFQRAHKHNKAIYTALTDFDGDVKVPAGFFTMPEHVTGKLDFGENLFLVFYFQNQTDYDVVLKAFEILTSRKLSHPKLDSKKLAKMVKRYNNE